MTRSLPEKTFEHWTSIHLSYRYRAKLRMWWPSAGADIAIDGDRLLPGKRYWLELKCPEWQPATRGGTHVLEIDLNQLHAYGLQGVPDYYVFPIPPWDGVLGDTDSGVWLGARHRSDVGYQSHSGLDWFAEWSWVVSGARLRGSMSSQIAAFLSGNRSAQARVFSVSGSTITWARGVKGLKPVKWRDFLETMENCGSPDFPAQFVLPSGTIRRSRGGRSGTGRHGPPPLRHAALTVTHAQLKKEMAAMEVADGKALDDAQVFSPRDDGRYVLTPLDLVTGTEGFVWGPQARRSLISMTRSALDLTD